MVDDNAFATSSFRGPRELIVLEQDWPRRLDLGQYGERASAVTPAYQLLLAARFQSWLRNDSALGSEFPAK